MIVMGHNYEIDHIDSVHAQCAQSVYVLTPSTDFSIHHNYIADSGVIIRGVDLPSQTWADGMTVNDCTRGHIYSNRFEDNTDIDLPISNGPCEVYDNDFIHTNTHAFAALNTGNPKWNGRPSVRRSHWK